VTTRPWLSVLSMQRFTPAQARRAFCAALLLALLVGLLDALGLPLLRRLDDQLQDRYVRAFPSSTRQQAVVVDIDETSIAAVGQWPWPRYRIARLLDQIAAQKPAAIALDIVLPDADRTSLQNVRAAWRRDFGVDVEISGLPAGLSDNDGFLGSQIAATGTIAADYFYFDHETRDPAPPRPGVGFDGRLDRLHLDVAPGVMLNDPAIQARARQTGFVNAQPDADGVLRRLPLLLSYRGVVHPGLALAAAMKRVGVTSATIEGDAGSLAIRVGPHAIPIDERGQAALRFAGDATAYPEFSAVDVLNGQVQGHDLAGRIVFVGSSMVGMNDIHRTAVDARFPGLKVQSVMAEAILGDQVVGSPPWARAASVGLCLVAGAVVSAFFLFGSGLGLGFAGATVSLALLLSGTWLYSRHGVLLPVAAPLLVVALSLAFFLVASVAVEQRRVGVLRRRLENARRVTMESMAAVAETRDPETGAHIKRTQRYVRAVALELRRRGHQPDLLTPDYIDLLFASAPLHDIGKVGVPDHILLKPARLTAAEMAVMQQHADFGRQIILHASDGIEGENFLAIAGEIAATHHEKWDGSGYPRGLVGEAIPLSGRIMAIADIYDALISRRCYKEPFTHAHAMTLIRGMRGSTFDPRVLDAFEAIEPEILEIAARYRDEEGLAAAPVSLAEAGEGALAPH